MAAEAERLLELAVRLGALTYGEFTLSSGKVSPYYFDGRLLTLDPEGRLPGWTSFPTRG